MPEEAKSWLKCNYCDHSGRSGNRIGVTWGDQGYSEMAIWELAGVSGGWGRVRVCKMTVHWLGAQGYCRATRGGVGELGRAECVVGEALRHLRSLDGS